MNKTSPIQIYLDSSDYSNLSSDQYAAEFHYLKKLVEEKLIEIRYSNVTVAEILHTEKKHQHYAIGRTKVLRDLCGRKCLVYTDTLLLRDCLFRLDTKNDFIAFPNYAYDDKSHWYPEQRGKFKNLKSELVQKVTNTVRDQIRQHPNPHERKLFKKKLKSFVSKGSFTTEGLKFIEGMDAAILEKFAFLDKSSPTLMLKKYLKGTLSHIELEDYLFENGADPANLAEFTIDQVEDGISKFQWIRKGGASLIENVAHLDSLIDTMEEIDSKNGIARSRKEIAKNLGLDFRNLRNKAMDECWENYKDEFRKRDISFKIFNAFRDNSEIGTLPSIDILIDVLPEYLQQQFDKNRKKTLQSDFGDITHVRYLPYLDIFRADRTMTHLFKKVAAKYETKVIRTLKELIDDLKARFPN